MKLPFELPMRKDTSTKMKEESAHSSVRYERKLAELRDTLETYKSYIHTYAGKLEGSEKRAFDNKLSTVQTALDITYLKEQTDKTIELLDEMKTDQMNKTLANLEHLITAVLDLSYKVDGLDKNVVNRLSDLWLELNRQNISRDTQQHEELVQKVDELDRRLKSNYTLTKVLFVFNLLLLGGLGFVILFIVKLMQG